MKKNIAIGLLTILSLLFFTFSYVQKKEADEMRKLAQKYDEEARKALEEAQRQTILAEKRQVIIDDLMKKKSN